jgi:hypothetical protein
MRTAVSTSTKALLASFEVSYLITKNKKKPHTIGETLLLPAAMKMCQIILYVSILCIICVLFIKIFIQHTYI